MIRRGAYLGLAVLACAMVAGAVQRPVDAQAPASAPVTFSRDVLPILQKSCQSCHRPGQIGPMPLLDYEQVRPWARAIKAQVVDRQMPPWDADPAFGHFTNDRSLSRHEIDTIAAWVDGGALQGDPTDAPPPVHWPPDGWIVQPDVVVTLPDYPVAATGTIEWENMAVPSPFTADTWITSIEILPSDPSTVHHMCFEFKPHRPEVVYNQYEWAEIPRDSAGAAIRPPAPDAPGTPANGETWVLTRDAGRTEVRRRLGQPILSSGPAHCYVPGMSLHDYRPFDAGQLVRAGSDMVFNLHYQTTGTPKVNSVKVGFTLAKERPRRKLVQLVPNGATPSFAIPPGEANYRAPVVELGVKQDAEIVWMSPHMHLRGKDMTWTMTYPDGREQTLLRVPRYRYFWQIQYQTRVPVPAGATLRMVAHYDNSAGNRENPDPKAWVYPGNQAWEEMMIPFTWLVVDAEVDERDLTTRYARATGA